MNLQRGKNHQHEGVTQQVGRRQGVAWRAGVLSVNKSHHKPSESASAALLLLLTIFTCLSVLNVSINTAMPFLVLITVCRPSSLPNSIFLSALMSASRCANRSADLFCTVRQRSAFCCDCFSTKILENLATAMPRWCYQTSRLNGISVQLQE